MRREGRLRSVIGRPGCNFTPINRDLNVGVEGWQSSIRRTMRTPRSCSWRDRNFEDTVDLKTGHSRLYVVQLETMCDHGGQIDTRADWISAVSRRIRSLPA